VVVNFLSWKIFFTSAVAFFARDFSLITDTSDKFLFQKFAQPLDPVFFLERF
jgi:hypothetical protein